jgi:hypothetical protein
MGVGGRWVKDGGGGERGERWGVEGEGERGVKDGGGGGGGQ